MGSNILSPFAHNIKLTCSYDGTRYLGWQKSRSGPSIESELEAVLEKILQHPVKLSAASRTDRGVHAVEQVISFRAKKIPSLISLVRLLPKDITVTKVEEVDPDFHATLHAKSKIYRYQLTSKPFQIPLNRLYEWHYPYQLDIDLMRQGAKFLIGTHDFKALTNKRADEDYESTVRTLSSILIEEPSRQNYVITVTGKSFLYKMVRNIVGLLLFVGRGEIHPKEVPNLLKSLDRKKCPVSAAAHGLTLLRQIFDNEN